MIVVLDACVLYPPSLRDLLLTLAALDAYDVRWSDEILDEVTRNVVADHPDLDAGRFVQHTIGAMRRAFPEASTEVPIERVDALDNDPKDRHVGAVALAASADVIVTLNTADFGGHVLRDAGIEILTPGAIIGHLLDEVPDVVEQAVEHIANRWVDPVMAPCEIVDLLAVHPTMKEPMAALRERLVGSQRAS